jgi:phosphoribosylformylglycinamidine (FGAM) synthase-like enzyme
VTGEEGGTVPAPDPSAPQRYRIIHGLMNGGLVESAHDVSEGGLAVALAEMALGGDLGIAANIADDDECRALFSESLGRIVLEVREENAPRVLEGLGQEATVIGRTVADQTLTIVTPAGTHAWTLADLERAWRGSAR